MSETFFYVEKLLFARSKILIEEKIVLKKKKKIIDIYLQLLNKSDDHS